MNDEEKALGGVGTMYAAALRPSMKERQRQLREDAILDAALELLKVKGYDAMTLEDITESIGISRPTLYLHFKSKEDLVLHISMRCRVQLLEFIGGLELARPAGDRLIDFCDFALDLRFGTQGMAFGDIMKVISSQVNEPPEMAEAEAKLMEAYIQLVEEAQAEGSVRRDMSSTLLSQAIVGLIKNYTFDSLIAEGKVTVAEIKDVARKLLLPGS